MNMPPFSDGISPSYCSSTHEEKEQSESSSSSSSSLTLSSGILHTNDDQTETDESHQSQQQITDWSCKHCSNSCDFDSHIKMNQQSGKEEQHKQNNDLCTDQPIFSIAISSEASSIHAHSDDAVNVSDNKCEKSLFISSPSCQLVCESASLLQMNPSQDELIEDDTSHSSCATKGEEACNHQQQEQEGVKQKNDWHQKRLHRLIQQQEQNQSNKLIDIDSDKQSQQQRNMMPRPPSAKRNKHQLSVSTTLRPSSSSSSRTPPSLRCGVVGYLATHGLTLPYHNPAESRPLSSLPPSLASVAGGGEGSKIVDLLPLIDVTASSMEEGKAVPAANILSNKGGDPIKSDIYILSHTYIHNICMLACILFVSSSFLPAHIYMYICFFYECVLGLFVI